LGAPIKEALIAMTRAIKYPAFLKNAENPSFFWMIRNPGFSLLFGEKNPA